MVLRYEGQEGWGRPVSAAPSQQPSLVSGRRAWGGEPGVVGGGGQWQGGGTEGAQVPAAVLALMQQFHGQLCKKPMGM